MHLLSLRETDVFNALRQIGEKDFVLIGGYAVNAYSLPSFSIDCDIVVRSEKDALKIVEVLERLGYRLAEKNQSGGAYGGLFIRMDKNLENKFKVSFDILVGEVFDRQSGASFSADWVFLHAQKNRLHGKTIPDAIDLKIIALEALLVMKLISARKSDLRDVFMLLPKARQTDFVKKEIREKTGFETVAKKASETILSKNFKNNLQGVFGYLDDKLYQKHLNSFKALLEEKKQKTPK